METTNILGQPPSVWYIDNRLSQRHQMFNNAPVHYEPRSDQYVMNSQLAERAGLSAMTQPPPRPMDTDIRAMRVWNSMYLDAIEGFRSANEAPKRRSEEYSIHKAGDWDEVYAILERARGKYQDEGGKVGWFRNVRRKVADNVAPVQVVTSIVSKTVPDNPYSTPVLGAVGILLDAVKQSAIVRNQVAETFGGEGFENLIPIFSDVELFLGDMFDKDPNIRKASLDLAMAALKAIDLAVGFYTRKAVRQSSKALFMGSDYEKPLLDSLKDLNAKSRKLVEEAYKSHIYEAHHYSEYGRRMMRVLQETMGDLQETVVDGFNGMNRLLGEHIRLKDEQIQQKDAQLEQKNRELLYLKVENERLRSVSPAPSPWSPPVLPSPSLAQVPIPVPQPLISQEQLEMALEMSATDLYDMNFIFSTESEFPSLERAQTEQIIQQRLFANWVVCTDSSRLLVQWEAPLPHTYADLTPLSLFCAKMVQALAGKDRFLSIQWFYGCHLRYHAPEGSGHTMLLGLVAQLLRAYRGGFDMRALAHSIDLHTLLSSPDMKILERLLTWLVRALPRTVTLFCFVDGVVLCERSEHWDTAAPALLCLLRLVRDPAVQATVKVLFTSAPGPVTVRSDFDDEGLIVNVETLPRLATAPSDERMMRELGDELSFRTS